MVLAIEAGFSVAPAGDKHDRRTTLGDAVMDLGISGKKAIICASSKGLGRACARTLAREGVNITVNARHLAALAETAEAIRRDFGARVTVVAGDVTTVEGREALLGACPDPDILITNSGGPPSGDFRAWSEGDVAEEY